MKGDQKAIEFLQAQLKNELTAINQYFLHYRMLKHWGLDKLAKKEYQESIGEMKHADKLMDRIFMLDGLPNLQDLGFLYLGQLPGGVGVAACFDFGLCPLMGLPDGCQGVTRPGARREVHQLPAVTEAPAEPY